MALDFLKIAQFIGILIQALNECEKPNHSHLKFKELETFASHCVNFLHDNHNKSIESEDSKKEESIN